MADPSSYRPAPGSIPTRPGVYRFRDAEGRVIYVGKAKNLRSRLNSYFTGKLHFRTLTMVRTAASVDWTVVNNELEALQLEYTWIKQYDPRFNVVFKDDKSYPWVAVTWAEEFPRVFVGRGPLRKGVRYFGPYAQAWAIRQSLDSMLKAFPIRSCSAGVFRSAQAAGRPCLLGHIGKCSAPCVGWISAAQHREIVVDVCAFLSGKTRGLQSKLALEMREAAEGQEYERAAKLRDALASLEAASERNAIVLLDGTDADVVAFAEDPLVVAVQIFHIRDGRVRSSRGWVAERLTDAELAELVDTFLWQYYGSGQDLVTDIPRLILTSHLPSGGFQDLLATQRGSAMEFRVPQRGEKATLLQTVAANAQETLAQYKLRRSADLAARNQALAELQEALDLSEPPLRIECFDVSHLQGTDIVASMVVFEDGVPRKSEYRRFVIRDQDGSNDVAAMHEVLTRRFARLSDEPEDAKFAYRPALIVVDGGAPQVSAAHQALAEAGVSDLAICGLAKRLEEVWLPGVEFPVILSRTSEALFLLQRVRDEAHRFAISHHRARRNKAMTVSILDDVPRLGAKKRQAVLRHFGSLAKLRAASVGDIAQVPGVGQKLAAAIFAVVAQPSSKAINLTTGEVLD